MRKTLASLATILILHVASHATAGERVAESCSLPHVSAAMGLALDGDVVVIPPGAATWSTTLVVTKAIEIRGAGKSATMITAAMASTLLIDVSPGANKQVRVSGIGFRGGTPIRISGNRTGLYALDKVRIDHCGFTDGKDNILSSGWVEGLIDHNTFLNCNRAILVVGDDNQSWSRPIEAGTSHALFIEDNTFRQTNAGGGDLNESVYHQEGARSVVRYNDFDGTEYTSYDYAGFDTHGNQMGYFADYDWFRGQPLIEVYNNTFRYHHSYRVCNIRGGSLLFHDNAFTYSGGYSTEIILTEEEGYKPVFNPLRTEWAGEDQIMNSFFWNNTRNGATIADVTLYGASDSIFIQKNRDYFTHAPQATGGKAVYTGRPGGAESFNASGPNAYYPYTPYTYPHPLQSSTAGAPEAPTNLRLK